MSGESSRLQEAYETFLCEMLVGSEGFGNLALAHNQKTDGIAERVIFIFAFFQKFDGASVQIFINPNNFNFFI